MQYNEILALVKAVSEAGLSHFEYTEGNLHIAMNCPEKSKEIPEGAVLAVQEGNEHLEFPVQAPEKINVQTPEDLPSEQPAAVSGSANAEKKTGELVKSPLVGTFYAAPSENEPPFVQVGDQVRKGQTIGIVEAMKLMNEIESEYDGVVTEILVQNEETVEYGQPLFRIG